MAGRKKYVVPSIFATIMIRTALKSIQVGADDDLSAATILKRVVTLTADRKPMYRRHRTFIFCYKKVQGVTKVVS